MKILKTIHTAYGFGVFAIVFILLFPLLLIPIVFPKQHRLIGIFNRWWAKLLFIFAFLPYRVECRSRLDPGKQYIFCPNHFSYLDIPTLGLSPINAIFVGKSEMEKIPLFGFMYRKLHITVNRASLKSKFNTLKRSVEALEDGKSLVIFPEGGITTHHPPNMGRFKDGAFRVAIEKQIPIVPVTIPNNWIILPDTIQLLLHRGRIDLVFHDPIETRGMVLNDAGKLKELVFAVIATELKKTGFRGLDIAADKKT
jgi:1-acyl-sn-glycerol-3-phosphate acyltransferase